MREISIPGMQPGPIPMVGHVPGTDPAAVLKAYTDGLDACDPLMAHFRAVLARLERAESIAGAATVVTETRALVQAEGGYAASCKLVWALDALDKEVRGNE